MMSEIINKPKHSLFRWSVFVLMGSVNCFCFFGPSWQFFFVFWSHKLRALPGLLLYFNQLESPQLFALSVWSFTIFPLFLLCHYFGLLNVIKCHTQMVWRYNEFSENLIQHTTPLLTYELWQDNEQTKGR